MADIILFEDVTLVEFVEFILVFIAVVIIGKAAYALTRYLLEERLSRSKTKTIARLVQYAIIAAGFSLGFYEILGLSLSALAASLGIVGIAIAFSSQQIIQNVMAGVLISVLRPIQLEDWIEMGGLPATGVSRVKDITLTNTVLRDMDGRISYVPNSMIITSKVVNYTRSGFVAIPLSMVVAMPTDFDQLKQIVLAAADRDPYILPNVTESERSAIQKLFERSSVRKLLENKRDMSFLMPTVSIAGLKGDRMDIVMKIWIREIYRRDEIVTGFLKTLNERLTAEGVKLLD